MTNPDISLLGITPGECMAFATVSPKLFKANTIHTFFMKATKHEGAICLTSINYRHNTKAHMGQATTINKLQSDNNKLKSDNDQLRADFITLNTTSYLLLISMVLTSNKQILSLLISHHLGQNCTLPPLPPLVLCHKSCYSHACWKMPTLWAM